MTAQALLLLQGLAGLLPGTRAEPEGDGFRFVPVERPPFRWADLQQVPDDGNRYEIIDGGLLVTPPPDTEHADIAEALRTVLRDAVPSGVAVYTAALGVDLGASVRGAGQAVQVISATLHCTAMTDHDGDRRAGSEGGVAAAGRVTGFADGVFAIAITLLVLPLTEARLTDAGLAGELWALRPQLFAFALSFLVIGRFWLFHHRMFAYIARLDERLPALNLLLLLCVAFLPFPTKVVGEHATTVAAVFYAASMAGTGLAFSALWSYASAGRRLVHLQVDLVPIRRLRWRLLVPPMVFLSSIPVALVSPPAAWALWWLSTPAGWLVERRFLRAPC